MKENKSSKCKIEAIRYDEYMGNKRRSEADEEINRIYKTTRIVR